MVDLTRMIPNRTAALLGLVALVAGCELSAQEIPLAAAWEQGFPVPSGARRNEPLGGATSIAPGKNYTLIVYEVDSGVDVMTAFYAHHLPAAKRALESEEVRFFASGGYVRLARVGKGTRITLVIGPR
jgi:hypothetical protein